MPPHLEGLGGISVAAFAPSGLAHLSLTVTARSALVHCPDRVQPALVLNVVCFQLFWRPSFAYVAQAGLKLTILCLYLQSAEIIAMARQIHTLLSPSLCIFLSSPDRPLQTGSQVSQPGLELLT